jgi:signal transduction histidine kinase
VAPAVAACGFALENSRLHASLRAQLYEVQRSRTRIAQAEMEGRRRIERALHDGAQQSLLATAASLGAARFKASGDSDVCEAIDRANATLTTATEELRQLARGIHPPVLVQSGLKSAIEGVADRLGLFATLSIPESRLPSPIETTAYYVACEALTNAAKHAAADHIEVRVELDGTNILIDIKDNGRGGARLGDGTGLAGLIDRVEAIGGRMTMNSPPGQGTVVTAVLPCG